MQSLARAATTAPPVGVDPYAATGFQAPLGAVRTTRTRRTVDVVPARAAVHRRPEKTREGDAICFSSASNAFVASTIASSAHVDPVAMTYFGAHNIDFTRRQHACSYPHHLHAGVPGRSITGY